MQEFLDLVTIEFSKAAQSALLEIDKWSAIPTIREAVSGSKSVTAVQNFHAFTSVYQLRDQLEKINELGVLAKGSSGKKIDENYVLLIDDGIISNFAAFYEKGQTKSYRFNIHKLKSDGSLERPSDEAVSLEMLQCFSSILSKYKFLAPPPMMNGLRNKYAYLATNAQKFDPSRVEQLIDEIRSSFAQLEEIEKQLTYGLIQRQAKISISATIFRNISAYLEVVKMGSDFDRFKRPFQHGKILSLSGMDYSKLNLDMSGDEFKNLINNAIKTKEFSAALRIGRREYHKYYEKLSEQGFELSTVEGEAVEHESDALVYCSLFNYMLQTKSDGEVTAIFLSMAQRIRGFVQSFDESIIRPQMVHPKMLSALDMDFGDEKWRANLNFLQRALVGATDQVIHRPDTISGDIGQHLRDTLDDQAGAWPIYKASVLDDWKKTAIDEGDGYFHDIWDRMANSKLKIENSELNSEVVNTFKDIFQDADALKQTSQWIDENARTSIEESGDSFVKEFLTGEDELEIEQLQLTPLDHEQKRSAFLFRTGRLRYAIKLPIELSNNEPTILTFDELAGTVLAFVKENQYDDRDKSAEYLIHMLEAASVGMWSLVLGYADRFATFQNLNSEIAQPAGLVREIFFLKHLAYRANASKKSSRQKIRVRSFKNAWKAISDGCEFSQRHIRFRLARVGLILEALTSSHEESLSLGLKHEEASTPDHEKEGALFLNGEPEWGDDLTKSLDKWGGQAKQSIPALKDLNITDFANQPKKVFNALIGECLGIIRFLNQLPDGGSKGDYAEYVRFRAYEMFLSLMVCWRLGLIKGLKFSNNDLGEIAARRWYRPNKTENYQKLCDLRALAQDAEQAIQEYIKDRDGYPFAHLLSEAIRFHMQIELDPNLSKLDDRYKKFELAFEKLTIVRERKMELSAQGFPRRVGTAIEYTIANRLADFLDNESSNLKSEMYEK